MPKKSHFFLLFSLMSIFLTVKAFSQQAQQYNGILIYLIDNSGSMACFNDSIGSVEICKASELPPNRDFKIEQAKQAIKSHLKTGDFIDDNNGISPKKVILIELTGSKSDDLDKLCKINPLGTWDLESSPSSSSSIVSNVNSISRNYEGTTPITLALQEAMKIYQENDNVKIRLISDGGANCDESEQNKGYFSRKKSTLQSQLLKIPTPCKYLNAQVKKGVMKREDFYLDAILLPPSHPDEYKAFQCLETFPNVTLTKVSTYRELKATLIAQAKDNSWAIPQATTSSPPTRVIFILIPIIGGGLFIFARKFLGDCCIAFGNGVKTFGEGIVKIGENLKKDKE